MMMPLKLMEQNINHLQNKILYNDAKVQAYNQSEGYCIKKENCLAVFFFYQIIYTRMTELL